MSAYTMNPMILEAYNAKIRPSEDAEALGAFDEGTKAGRRRNGMIDGSITNAAERHYTP
jgi:hypothetical protein